MIENSMDINTVFLVHDEDQLLFTEIFFYNSQTGKGALLDIPGETGVIIEKFGKIDRIDRLYDPRNPDEYVRAVEGMIKQKIHFYLQIEIEKMPALVDIIGGLEIFVANPVEIVENEKTVLIPSGSITLDGDKAKLFITYDDQEENEVDISDRKEKYTQSLLKSFQKKGQWLTSPKVFRHFMKNINANLSNSGVAAFIREMSNLDSGRIVFLRVLGVRRTVDDQELLFSHYDGKLLRETVRQTVTSLSNIEVVSEEELDVVIEILNGTGVNGLASRTSQVFQSFGYEVANIGNYERSDVEKTRVIDKTGNISQAQRVASIIECSNVVSEIIPVETAEIDFTEIAEEKTDLVIILGKDFDGRYCKE
jgi:anionic cell wall polymer biosynthesis LytR-Cps2A-Psr (LCP) family protein